MELRYTLQEGSAVLVVMHLVHYVERDVMEQVAGFFVKEII